MKKKTRPKLIADVQKVFNKYIRLRDSRAGYFYCISCFKLKSIEHLQAGHYLPAGHYTSLRFDEINVNGQCIQCNFHKHGNQAGYRIGLIEKYGEEKIEWLEKRATHNVHKWDYVELKYLIGEYKEKIRKLG